MEIPDNLKYTTTDEWVKISGDGIATVGITDFAQHELTDIVYVTDFPAEGDRVDKGTPLAVIESVKAVADVMAPFTGVVSSVNVDLEEAPEKLNEAPYDSWIVKIKIDNESDLEDLLTPAQYKEKISK
ncbi:MAG: glycine cleavage system protein GcvH [Promethearchaeota archaeon]